MVGVAFICCTFVAKIKYHESCLLCIEIFKNIWHSGTKYVPAIA